MREVKEIEIIIKKQTEPNELPVVETVAKLFRQENNVVHIHFQFETLGSREARNAHSILDLLTELGETKADRRHSRLFRRSRPNPGYDLDCGCD